jgi:cephalosporin-C deacetylase
MARMHLTRTIRTIAALIAAVFLCAIAQADDQPLVVSPDHADGIYQAGQPIHWSVQWKAPTTAPAAIDFVLKRGGLTETGKGTQPLVNGAAQIDSTLDQPGTMLAVVKAKGADGKEVRALGGAVAGPEQIKPSAPCPEDFESFWQSKINELEAVPPSPNLEKADSGKDGVDFYKLTMNNIRGSHIHGQLARPTSGQKFPALLIVQWAGVYPLKHEWVVPRAAEGWLVLDIEAHDLPIDEPDEFYKKQSEGLLKDYPAIGNEDRDTSYFLRMYLSCYRAAEYLIHREDWDGKTLVVMGGSQGGLQTLMLAGLHPEKITAACAIVPAGCDMLGPDIGRQAGWPMWYWAVGGKDSTKVRQASRYYDVVNFASRIKCPVLIGAGLIDETCPPEGIIAAANQIKSPKELILLPQGQHGEINGSHGAYMKRCYDAWLPALRQGQPAPVKQ